MKSNNILGEEIKKEDNQSIENTRKSNQNGEKKSIAISSRKPRMEVRKVKF